MQTNKLKTYAPKARRDFIAAVARRAARFGLTDKGASPMREEGELVLLEGQPYPRSVGVQRDRLAARIRQRGFEQVMEAAAYTWFNRLMAIRFMELHGYLDHSFRILSPSPLAGEGRGEGASPTRLPEILAQAQSVDLPGLNRERVIELKLDGTKDEELYRELLLAQCRALHQAMPFLFEPVDDETELLLPDNLLQTDSLIRELVGAIPEEDWQEIEIVGWLYQFYISEKKDQVIGKVVKSEDIPAATQLFTPNWIVKYMVQNSLGAQWLATYPDSPLKGQMEYYIEPAEQTPEVQAQLAAITPSSLNPEELTLIDPACGSGHILVEAYDLFKAIYLERGYRPRDIPRLILEKNLFGLDIDERAAQLAGFALMMKARADDRRLFERGVKLNVMALVDSAGFDAEGLVKGIDLADYGLQPGELTKLKRLFEHATTFGSLIQVPEELATKLPSLRLLSAATTRDLFLSDALSRLGPLAQQAEMLAAQYDAVVANPPYMGAKFLASELKSFLAQYPTASADIYPAFLELAARITAPTGTSALITLQNWLYLSGMEELRRNLLTSTTLRQIVQIGFNSFPSMNSKFAVAAVTVFRPGSASRWVSRFINLDDAPASADKERVFHDVVSKEGFVDVPQALFESIPGRVIAYTLSPTLWRRLIAGPRLDMVAPPRRGLATGDNPKFIRFWWEVAFAGIELPGAFAIKYKSSARRWFVYNMGGDLRKWYGNLNHVVNWEGDGFEIKNLRMDTGRLRSRPQNVEAYFYAGITWKEIGIDFCGRYYPTGVISDQTSDFLIAEPEKLYGILAFLNSSIAATMMRSLNPTLHFNVGTLRSLPVPSELFAKNITQPCERLIELARQEWNEAEVSFDFKIPPLVSSDPAQRQTLHQSVERVVACSSGRLVEISRHSKLIDLAVTKALGCSAADAPDVSDGYPFSPPAKNPSKLLKPSGQT